jgi:hypothetical protein
MLVRLGSDGLAFFWLQFPGRKMDGVQDRTLGKGNVELMLGIDKSPLYKEAERFYMHGARKG